MMVIVRVFPGAGRRESQKPVGPEEDIREYCSGQITHFKIPKYIKLVHEFPMTVTGKMQKFVMRDTFAEELHLK